MKDHLKLQLGSRINFRAQGRVIPKVKITRSCMKEHIPFLKKQFQAINNNPETLQSQDGKIFIFQVDKKFPIRSLPETKLVVLRAKEINDEINEINVWIPTNKISSFINSLDEARNKIQQLPHNSENPLTGTIIERYFYTKNIIISAINQLCDDTVDKSSPSTQQWLEIWIYRKQNQNKETLIEAINNADISDIQFSSTPLEFPTRFVLNIKASLDQLTNLIRKGVLITCIRPIPILNQEFTQMSILEQKEWSEELIHRTSLQENAPIIGLLDNGILKSHPLLEPYIASTLSYDSNWGTDDTPDPHGTLMAGIILYDDLNSKLLTTSNIKIPCEISSFKLLHRPHEHKKELYGVVTAQAISRIEIEHPNVALFCMAITAQNLENQGKLSLQSSWSSMIDKLSYGDGIIKAPQKKQRLFFISAGNLNNPSSNQCPKSQRLGIMEDPAQAFNAITVGGYTNFTSPDYLAPQGGLSPLTTTGLLMKNTKYYKVLKPDIVCEAGNLTRPNLSNESLSALTTDGHPTELFTIFEGTSLATAQAVHIASHIVQKYPTYRPETIRALLIHSSEWTDTLKQQFLKNQKKESYQTLVQICGYGVPSIERAIHSTEKRVCLIIEDELQPFHQKEDKSIVYHECKLHALPLPMLNEFDEAHHLLDARLRVTLSYFIEPLPEGLSTSYHSCGLNFILQNSAESETDFRTRASNINDEGDTSSSSSPQDSHKWLLGVANRQKGSIHSDIWETPLSELLGCKNIAIIPRTGWWKERKRQGKFNSTIRYSLIISVDTSEDIGLYTKIKNQIDTSVEISI